MSSFPDHLQGLLRRRAYPHPVRTVDVIETLISWVLLTGRFVYKIKRPVQYPFIDLRSARQRRVLCREEVRLNRRFAPVLYLGVCTIRRHLGQPRVGGSGRVIEHAVQMRQFPRSQELAALLQARRIGPAELASLGVELARIHARLPVARAGQQWGEPGAQIAGIKLNAAECVRAAVALADPRPGGGTAGAQRAARPATPAARRATQSQLARLRATLAQLGNWADAAWPLLAARFAARRVRECHGDLHAGNIVRYGGRLLPFDCLEFDRALRWIDVADEVSFLLADLEARARPRHAQAFLDSYLSASGDYQGCLLVPVFKAHRALVRAKVLALTATAPGTSPAAARAARRSFGSYVKCAQAALAPPRPALVLMSGLSGSGKTRLAARLAPALHAVHLRSDIERKRLARLAPLARSASALGRGLYEHDMSVAVYERLAECAADTLAGGYTTIVDATFGRLADRMRFRALATRLGVSFCIVYCHAPPALLRRRIIARARRSDDASEANIEVLRWQQTHFIPPTADEARPVLDAARLTPADLVRQVAARCAARGARPCA